MKHTQNTIKVATPARRERSVIDLLDAASMAATNVAASIVQNVEDYKLGLITSQELIFKTFDACLEKRY